MGPSGKLAKGIRMIEEKGHHVEARVFARRTWWEIDHQMLATAKEIENIADRVYTPAELGEELHIKRRIRPAGGQRTTY